ncbi:MULTISPECIES: flagellin [Citrobacter]|uniref:flagellin N-terminal helical domain-containing protein n=1 Tax=Citrobacter TaxID=544 RepID=UPI00079C93E3|nr:MULTISPECIES: flagellin [Citrobacter]MDM2800395.1 flagellin [Citrobacter sp. Cpo131]MDM2891003.1 flagellin [Citrobacter sp. Cpo060]MDW2647650.1 flagellin [Citrobacter portucalensis]SAC90627.1 Flagellar biosynthesis protein FliC [Enterobacter cloacae]
MAQVINTNSLSLLTQNNLNKSQSSLSSAIERLSSGLRINSAKDDAAGQAIANRFTANVKGLTQASRNANDGISVAQTTEGSLNEINNNLQRIRELSVQATNGTNSDSDLTSIQSEIQQRLSEIDRVSGQTQFNGVKVLASNQDMTIQVGANDGETITIKLQEINSDTLGLSGFGIKKAEALDATEVTTIPGADVSLDKASTITTVPNNGAIDGDEVYTDTSGKLYVKVKGTNDGATPTPVDTPAKDGYYAASADKDGKLTITGTDVSSVDPADLKETTTAKVDISVTPPTGYKLNKLTDANGKDTGAYALVNADGKRFAANVDKNGNATLKTVSYKDADGKAATSNIELGGLDGKTEVVTIGSGVDAKTYSAVDLKDKNLKTDSLTSLSTSKTNDPLAALDKALSQVDALRSNLGAIQNRFDSAITNLGNTVNNLSSARSRIEDADYATEVSNMSRAQILQQAGTSVLAQANQVPQNVLSLLR